MTKKEIYDKIDEWIKKIKNDSSYKDINDSEIENNIINILPFNFFKRENNKIILKSKENDYYIKIYNQFILNALENTEGRKYQIIKRETLSGYRLRTYTKNKEKSKNTISDSKFENLEKEPYFENNIWEVKQNKEIKIISLDEFQQEALDRAIKWPISIITGFAGTGKSHTIKYLSQELKKNGWSVSRLAPTGRASQVINGKTIHSWLEPIIQEWPGNRIEIIGFKKKTVSEKECIIIDESSMMDQEIWSQIVNIWRNSKNNNDKKIILVGDVGQLEPVGEGRPFLDLIQSKKFPVTALKKFHRNKNNSELIDFSIHLRNKGYFDKTKEYKNIKYISKKEALNVINEDPSIQMITPYRKGEMGSLEINKKIKELMNIKEKESFKTILWNDGNRKYEDDAPVHLDDKIVINRNLWKWNITNGTIGIFKGFKKIKLYNYVNNSYTKKRNCLIFLNPTTKKLFYLPSNKKTLQSIELAFAITIHKAQGSEFNNVVMYIPQTWVEPKALYTGITRTKGKLLIYKV